MESCAHKALMPPHPAKVNRDITLEWKLEAQWAESVLLTCRTNQKQE